MTVGIVYGGYSTEKAASIENAGYIRDALTRRGYAVRMIEYSERIVEKLRDCQSDIVYVCVQGKGHGDGTLQAMLDHEHIPYTGSGMEAACLINNKIISKLIFDYHHIRTPRWAVLTYEQYISGTFDYEDFGYPFVAKAPSQGGSFGIELIHGSGELEKLKDVFAYDNPVLVEEYIAGGFYTIGIIEQAGELRMLPIVEGVELRDNREVHTTGELITFTGDYDARPARLPQRLMDEMEQTAKTVFSIMKAEGVARVDYMIDEDMQHAYMLEINAVPGLKPRSLLPKEAAYAGIGYDDLIEGILLSAWDKAKKEQGDGKDV